MALGIGYGLPFVAQHGTNPYKTQWAAAREGAKGAGATVEDENAGTGSCLVSRGQDVYTDGLPFTPSMLIVPQFYKDGNLYQDVPPFVAEDSTMRFTVSRNTTATRVNSSGLIESVASGVPRIDWLGQSCPALLVEASGQNLAFHSESWSTASNWNLANGVTRATGSTSAFLTPDNTLTANAISPTSGNVSHSLFSNSPTTITYVSGTIYTQSAFIKAGTGAAGRYAQLTFSNTRFSQAGFANFDLQNGTVTLVSGTSADTNRNARIENYGNGWYRCSFTATATGNGADAGFVLVLITASGDSRVPQFAGTITDVIYGWGAQVETGANATTYIPTTSGAVSRAADSISASGALVSGLIGQTEGTIYAEFVTRVTAGTAAKRVLTISNGDDGNRISIGKAADDSLVGLILTGGVTQALISTAANQSGTFKMALAFQANDAVLYINGVQIGTDNLLTMPTGFNRIDLGQNAGNAAQFNDRIRAAALYTTRLSNDQLAELTRL